jgi:hypothetical protein
VEVVVVVVWGREDDRTLGFRSGGK